MAFHCPMMGCSNGSYRLMKWKAAVCESHGVPHEDAACLCHPPFRLYPLPTRKTKSAERDKWIRLINRSDVTANERPWSPSKSARVCSNHFIDGKPTHANPYPTMKLGYQGFEGKVARMLCFASPAASLGPRRRKRPKLFSDQVPATNSSTTPATLKPSRKTLQVRSKLPESKIRKRIVCEHVSLSSQICVHGCQSKRTESRSKSQKNEKRKLASKVKSKRKRKGQTKKTCNDEHRDTEEEYIIKIERDEDCERDESYVNSFPAWGTETASETLTVLKKQIKIEPGSVPDNTFETCSNSEESHRYLADSGKTVKLEPDDDYLEWPAVTFLPETRANTETVVKTEPCNDTKDQSPGLFETSKRNFKMAYSTVAEMEVKTEPCSDTEERPPVSCVTSNMAHSTHLADSNMMLEPVRTIVKTDIKSDSDDSEQPTTVYVCTLCNKFFYSHHQLLKHAENHEKNSNIFVGHKPYFV